MQNRPRTFYALLRPPQGKTDPDQVKQYQALLDKFHRFLGEFSPSIDLATQFLAEYENRTQNTTMRYAGILRGFTDWHGEILDIRPLKPRSLPEYVDPKDIEKLIDFIQKRLPTREQLIGIIRWSSLLLIRGSDVVS